LQELRTFQMRIRPGNSPLYLRTSFFLTFLVLCLNSGLEAQVLKINCIEPYTVVFPLKSADTTEINFKDHANHTFWYKFLPEKTVKLRYQVTPVLPGASFKVEVYEYDGGIFCKQMVKESITPFEVSSDSDIKLRAGFTYYLGVSNKSTNCGHQLRFFQKDITTIVRTTELGSECANLMEYNRQAPPDKIAKDKPIIDGLVLKGEVFSKLTKGSLNADLTFQDSKAGTEIKTLSYRLKGYELNLDRGVTYQLRVYAMGFVPIDTQLTVTSDTELNFHLAPVEKGEKFIIDNIYFYPNTFACKPESQEALEALKDYMLENKKIRIEIQGHTNGNKDIKKVKNNPRSGEEWNFEGSARELSKLRADKLMEYLVSNGVSRKRITTVGKGGEEMIVPEPKDMKEASKNIRVEIKIL